MVTRNLTKMEICCVGGTISVNDQLMLSMGTMSLMVVMSLQQWLSSDGGVIDGIILPPMIEGIG